jgi:hypothetical protein
MEPAKRAGRIVGSLILLQMLGGGLVNGVLETPLFGSPGFLIAAAPHSQQIGLAVVLGIVTSSLWLAIAVTMFSLEFKRRPGLALSLVALATVALAAAVAEGAGVMSMVSLSRAYAKADVSAPAQFEAARVAVASARNGAHFLGKVIDGVTAFLLYALVYGSSRTPRWIPAFGMAAAALLVSSVGRPIFGYEVVFPLLAPLALSQLTFAIWLLSRGFREVT